MAGCISCLQSRPINYDVNSHSRRDTDLRSRFVFVDLSLKNYLVMRGEAMGVDGTECRFCFVQSVPIKCGWKQRQFKHNITVRGYCWLDSNCQHNDPPIWAGNAEKRADTKNGGHIWHRVHTQMHTDTHRLNRCSWTQQHRPALCLSR